MADQGHHQADQSSGFWTLTRPSKLTKRRNSDLHELHHKVFNIGVVGLSGVEKDKGPIGIGKSCLCNRFIRSAADDYHTDHISVLSQSDFSGRVVNNDHWLYWGSVIKSCDGYDLAFNVIEQTEFVDDACFQPFKSGKTEPYFKRCANTKLVSAEKLMYICKNQLGIEREYEQRYLPDGKFNVDGFLCLFDVSEVQGRNLDKQIEMTNLIMLNLIKTRKPIVFVTTKHDEASELLVAEAERLVNQRDFRGLVPIVETSAQENVNINVAFLVCAQLIDKTRAKLRVLPYYEAYKNHIELLNVASEAYLGLIRSTVIDYRTSWQQVCIKLSHNPEFLQYTYLHGLDKATLVFKNHLKLLHEECINQKVQVYLKIFPDVLNELVPRITANINMNNNNIDLLDNSNLTANSSMQAWNLAKEQIRSHPLFNKYFVQIRPGISWFDTDLLQSNDNRIPSDWLESEEAYCIFQQRNLLLENEQRRQATKKLFSKMLTDTKIPVGKPFIELKHIFAGNTSLEILSDQELFEVYVEYQNNLLQKARADFQELLLENAEHLHHLTSGNKVIRQEDIKTINTILQHDERYQALSRFDQDRTLMMIRHLSFLHSQTSEQCPSYPKCVEPEVERLLITKAKTLVSRYFESRQDNGGKSFPGLHSKKTCELLIFGPHRPSQQLRLALNVLNSRAPKGSQYQINFTVFDNYDEMDSQMQRFRQSDTKPKGCFGIFTNRRSLDHVGLALDKFLHMTNQVNSEKNHFGSPPAVMLYAADITLDERTMLALENEGQKMADQFKCPFMNVTAIEQYRQHQQNSILTGDNESSNQVMSECSSLDYACVDAAFNVLKEAVSRRVCFMELYNNQDLIPRQAFNPDARILMCLLCGEPFSNELFMWRMFLDYEDCYVTSSKSICLKVRLENGQEKFIEITTTSYTHGAFNYREDLLHGFILVCSIQRKASLAILNAFSFNIPCTPVLVMAIKSDVQQDDYLDSDETDALIKEAQAVAQKLKGHFELLDVCQSQLASSSLSKESYSLDKIRNFFQSVIKRKPTIEKAYKLGDSEIPLPSSSSQAYADNDDYMLQSSAERMVGQRFGGCGSSSSAEKSSSKQRYYHTNLSSDDDLNNDNMNGQLQALDRDCSDEDSEAYSTISNSAPPKPARFTKQDREGNYNKLESVNNKNSMHQQNQNASDETNDSSSDDDDTEDSTDNKLDKPKPGKLDLRQFDNITTAIGKLNVQPASVPTPPFAPAKPERDLPKPAPRSTQAAPTKSTPTQAVSTFANSTSSGTKRIGNPRQNHGRAVAPPKLPGSAKLNSANRLNSEQPAISGNATKEPQITAANENQSHVLSSANDVSDFSQSPIAQRLLKFSKDHKVSELNSPYDSDCDSPVPRSNHLQTKGQKIIRGQLGESPIFTNSSIDSSELINQRGAAIQQLNKILANKRLPGAPPHPATSRSSSLDYNDQQQSLTKQKNDKDKDGNNKKDKKKIRDDEKLEKRRLKEEERIRRQEKKLAAKKSKSNNAAGSAASVGDDGVPLFIKRCIEFIELEGLDAEGIYRVPGNRAHVDTFVQKFKENPNMSILDADIPVNAVATALKDFLSKKWGPIIPLDLMNELTELSNISEKEQRVQALRLLVKKLPAPNYKLLKYVFSHFVKVSLNHSLNSMDSKNLAICWWPTLLPFHFNDMVMFEQMRPHLEESIQTMIDQYDCIFDTEEPSSNVQ